MVVFGGDHIDLALGIFASTMHQKRIRKRGQLALNTTALFAALASFPRFQTVNSEPTRPSAGGSSLPKKPYVVHSAQELPRPR